MTKKEMMKLYSKEKIDIIDFIGRENWRVKKEKSKISFHKNEGLKRRRHDINCAV